MCEGEWEWERERQNIKWRKAQKIWQSLQRMTERTHTEERERDSDAPEENGKLNYTVVMVVSWYPVIKPKQKWNRIKTTVKENKHQSNSEFYFIHREKWRSHCTYK